MRFRLRTLMIVLAIGPPVLAAGWWAVKTFPDTAPFIIILGLAAAYPLVLRSARAAISRDR